MIRKRFKNRYSFWPVVAAAIWLGGCLFAKDEPEITSTEIPNELTGTLVLKNGTPVPGANVSVYRVDQLPMLPGSPKIGAALNAQSVVTDAAGRFHIKGLTEGEYNILGSKAGLASLSDSVTVTASGLDIGMDTLKPTGALVGWVRLQPNHSPRTAWIQVAGTSVFTNVAADGSFMLSGLAEGPYQLRVSTTELNYSPLFAAAWIRAGMTDTLKDALVPYFSGIPVVTGLQARMVDSGRSVRLEWNPSDYPFIEAYLVYRDSGSAPLPVDTLVGRTTATVFIDTVFSENPRLGQIPLTDPHPHRMAYRIKILTQERVTGPAFGGATLTLRSPSVVDAQEAVWTRAVEHAQYFKGGVSAAAVWNDSLWVLSVEGRVFSIWGSADGFAWKKSTEATGLVAPDADTANPSEVHVQLKILNGQAWILMSQRDAGVSYKNALWKSTDLRKWTLVTANPGFSGRDFAAFLAHDDALWVANGSNAQGPMGLANLTDVWRSVDGKNWTKVTDFSFNGFTYFGGATIHDGKMWMVGGGQFFYPDSAFSNLGVWNSTDGKTWNASAYKPAFLPRTQFALEPFQGELWVVGGNRYDKVGLLPTATTWNDAGRASDVWSSPDGITWSRRNAQAPFGARGIIVSAVWKNKLWIFGGSDPQGNPLTDVWFAESP